MLLYEHLFKDETGFRIDTRPNEALGREVETLIIRAGNESGKVRVLKIELYDPDTKEFLFPALLKGLMQPFLKEHGKACERCEELYLPTSPSQKLCPECKETE
jgi:methionyl-tRNA synthetase